MTTVIKPNIKILAGSRQAEIDRIFEKSHDINAGFLNESIQQVTRDQCQAQLTQYNIYKQNNPKSAKMIEVQHAKIIELHKDKLEHLDKVDPLRVQRSIAQFNFIQQRINGLTNPSQKRYTLIKKPKSNIYGQEEKAEYVKKP